MSPRTPLRELGQVLERLLEEPDARRRERLLAHCVFDARLASAVAMYVEGEPWRRLVGCGATDCLPGAELVAAVADGEIGPDLPPDRLVVVGGSAPRRRALVLAGTAAESRSRADSPSGGDEHRADLFEALLTFLSCLDSVDGLESDLDDRVLPPFQRDAGPRSAGADIAHDLRALLRSIRARQDELDLLEDTLDDQARDQLAEVVDRECQLAGDLLLDAFAVSADELELACGAARELPGAQGPWARILEEIAAEHAEHLVRSGSALRVSVIDPGPLSLGATEGDYRIVVEMLLDVARERIDPTGGIDLSLVPQRRDGVSGLQLCAEGRRRDPESSAPADSRLAALRERVQRVGEAPGKSAAQLAFRAGATGDETARVTVWLPGV